MKKAVRFSSRPSAFTSRATTVFATNVNNSGPIEGTVAIDPNFKGLMSDILPYLNYYAVGDFNSIKVNLTSDKYIALSGALGRLLISDPTLVLLRTSFTASLQGLQRAYVQFTQLTDCEASHELIKERVKILDDMDLLKAYIAELNSRSNTSIFGDHVIESSVPALIPEAYLLYIQKYGFPADGVFDVVKLGEFS